MKFLKTTCTKKQEKGNIFFNITKAYKSKEKYLSANRACRCSQDKRQVIIGYKTCKKTEKKRTAKN